MFYFLYGNSPMIEFETEKKTEEILEKYPNISAKYYDCALKEEDEFLSALQVNSIFKTVDFLVLKRAETLKSSGIQKLFKTLKNYDLNEKNIIILYNVPIQYGKIVTEYEITKTSIKAIEEIATFLDCTLIKETNIILNYVKDNLKGYSTSNYQALVNFLPETRNVINDFDNSIMRMRYNQEAQYCDDMFVRHLGSLELSEKNMRKSIYNPFADFAEGVKLIISLPVLLLKWFGFISAERSRKIKKNPILKIINFIVTAVGFVSGIMAIIMGWNDFWMLIKSFVK